MSREQLDFLIVASGTPGAMSGVTGENDPKMQEGAMNANINTTGESLSKLDKTTDEPHAESKNEQGSGEGNNSIVAAAQGLPLQNVDEDNHAAVLVEEKGETDDSSLTIDDKVKDKSEGEDAAHATVVVVSDDEGGDTEDTVATAATAST